MPCIAADRQFEGYEVAMVDGKIAFSAGSTVPLVEDIHTKLPPREAKPDAEVPSAPKQIEAATSTDNTDPTVDAEMTNTDDADNTIAVKEEPTEVSDEIIPIASKAFIPTATAKAVSKSTLPGSLFVGDLRLAILKNRLSTLTPPLAAEFAGEGILICGPGIQKGRAAPGGSVVAVRKLGEGEIVLEGGLGRTYEVVRKELYKGFARVVAG